MYLSIILLIQHVAYFSCNVSVLADYTLVCSKYMTDSFIFGHDNLLQIVQLFEDLLHSPSRGFWPVIDPSVFETHDIQSKDFLIFSVTVYS